MSGLRASGVSRRRGPLSALASLVAPAVLLATSAGPAAAAGAGPVVGNRQYGFTFRLPTGWYALPIGAATTTKLGALGSSGTAAGLTPLLRQGLEQRAASQHLVVMAFGRGAGSSGANLDVQVLHSGLPTGIPAGAVASILQSSIGRQGKVHRVRQLHLGGAGLGYRVDLTLNVSATSSMNEVEELFPHDQRTYIVTFTGTDPEPVMATWHWTS
jgi:hypothetical protein